MRIKVNKKDKTQEVEEKVIKIAETQKKIIVWITKTEVVTYSKEKVESIVIENAKEVKKEMTGRDLENKLHYLGMVRGIRKLALKEKMANAEKLAEMTEVEVCDLVAKKYEVVYSESEELGLMEKEKFKEFQKEIKVISR